MAEEQSAILGADDIHLNVVSSAVDCMLVPLQRLLWEVTGGASACSSHSHHAFGFQAQHKAVCNESHQPRLVHDSLQQSLMGTMTAKFLWMDLLLVLF